jgi:hypothetical protein
MARSMAERVALVRTAVSGCAVEEEGGCAVVAGELAPGEEGMPGCSVTTEIPDPFVTAIVVPTGANPPVEVVCDAAGTTAADVDELKFPNVNSAELAYEVNENMSNAI